MNDLLLNTILGLMSVCSVLAIYFVTVYLSHPKADKSDNGRFFSEEYLRMIGGVKGYDLTGEIAFNVSEKEFENWLVAFKNDIWEETPYTKRPHVGMLSSKVTHYFYIKNYRGDGYWVIYKKLDNGDEYGRSND